MPKLIKLVRVQYVNTVRSSLMAVEMLNILFVVTRVRMFCMGRPQLRFDPVFAGVNRAGYYVCETNGRRPGKRFLHVSTFSIVIVIW